MKSRWLFIAIPLAFAFFALCYLMGWVGGT